MTSTKKPKKKTKISEIVGDYSMTGTRRMQSPGNLRAGYPVRGTHGSLLDDFESNEEAERQSLGSLPKAVVIYVTKNGKILAVTRGSNLEDKNLPGGNVEVGEDPKDAAVRELWEETGIRADALFPVYSRVYDGYLVTAYRVTQFRGDLRQSDEGIPSWEDPSVLLQGSFSNYLQDMMLALYHGELSERRLVKN